MGPIRALGARLDPRPRVARLDERALHRLERRLARGVVAVPTLGLERIGSDYGGWMVPTALIGAEWVCYCGGVGEDITFDLGLIERFGCRVFAFDPTPRAIAHVERLAPDPRFTLVPVGLWSEDTRLRFYGPADPAHVSHSVVNLQRTRESFEAPVRSIRSLMDELGHETIDLLKIDIEGAEHAVLSSLPRAGVRPTVICAEIDRPVSTLRAWLTTRRVAKAGYALVAMRGWDLTWVRREALPSRGEGSG
jgi:FkbM family methyltransferase